MTKNTEIHVTTCVHFDPTWRRCFDRRFEYNGLTFASYADIEGWHIDDNLAIAEANPEYRFDIESPIVVRKYLEHHPEKLQQLQTLAREGRFRVGGTGDNVIDVNMVLGESIVRNFLLGQRWTQELFGYLPELALRNDGFGNCSQLPQILRGCGFNAVSGLSYTLCKARFWRGLDGSTILKAAVPSVSASCSTFKYVPCATCAGKGCDDCVGRGIGPGRIDLPPEIDDSALNGEIATVHIGGEEYLPNPGIIKWVKERADMYRIRFACEEERLAAFQEQLAMLDAPPADDTHDGELNPNNSGCLVTRIRTKQNCRQQEYALLAAEALNALADHGKPSDATRALLTETWQKLLFTMFHDAITATHIDAAYAELQDIWREIDDATAQLTQNYELQQTPAVVNMSGGPASTLAQMSITDSGPVEILDQEGQRLPITSVRVENGVRTLEFLAREVPAYGTTPINIRSIDADAEPTISDETTLENQRFLITADEHGITQIFDKKLKRPVAVAGEYRPAELILERDYGSAWATLWEDQTRTPLAKHTTFERKESGNGWTRLVFTGGIPMMRTANQCHCPFTLCVTLVDGLDRVDFHLDVHWDSHSARLRIALPTGLAGDAVYGVPYGMQVREEYEPWFNWAGANGDWPATDWAGVQSEGASVALLSKGLPSYRTETADDGKKTVFLSVLRSPTDGSYLNEPRSYSMPEYMGMRDVGEHSFDFAISAYTEPFADSDVVNDATVFSAGLPVIEQTDMDAPVLESDAVRIAAIKAHEDGPGMIVRLWEYRGKGGKATIRLPVWCRSVRQTDLLERPAAAIEILDDGVSIKLMPWQISTLLLAP